jgi:plasmid stability protein
LRLRTAVISLISKVSMPDLLIRNIDPHLKRQLEVSARAHRRSLSEEARSLLKKALLQPVDERKMGIEMMALVPKEFRSDDLVFEIPGEVSRPPEFE